MKDEISFIVNSQDRASCKRRTMVSLRSGSTTDKKDTVGTAEVSSTRKNRRRTDKQDSRLVETESNKADQAELDRTTAKKIARSRPIILPPIAEAPHSGVSTGKVTFLRLLLLLLGGILRFFLCTSLDIVRPLQVPRTLPIMIRLQHPSKGLMLQGFQP